MYFVLVGLFNGRKGRRYTLHCLPKPWKINIFQRSFYNDTISIKFITLSLVFKERERDVKIERKFVIAFEKYFC